MKNYPLSTALDALRYVARTTAAGLFIYSKAELTCLAVAGAGALGHWLHTH